MSDHCSTPPSGYPSDCEILEGYRERSREKLTDQTSLQYKRALAKAKELKLLLLDVDGVLTDGNLLYLGDSQEAKSFNTQDGFGLRLLMDAGIKVGVITARKSPIVERRATELKMRYIYQGIRNKNEAFKAILKESGLQPFQIGYMGDDWLDLPLLQQVGFAIAPQNGVTEVKEIAHFTTEKAGGNGAVREACMLILEAKKVTAELLQKYKKR